MALIRHTLYNYTLKKWWVYITVSAFLLISTVAASRFLVDRLYFFMMSGNTGLDVETDQIDIPIRWISYWIAILLGNIAISNRKKEENEVQYFVKSEKRTKWWNATFIATVVSAIGMYALIVLSFEVTEVAISAQGFRSVYLLLWLLNIMTIMLIMRLVEIKYNSVMALMTALVFVGFSVFVNDSFLLLDSTMIVRVTEYGVFDVIKNVITNVVIILGVYLLGYSYVKRMEW